MVTSATPPTVRALWKTGDAVVLAGLLISRTLESECSMDEMPDG